MPGMFGMDQMSEEYGYKVNPKPTQEAKRVMKYYIATSLDNHKQHNLVRDILGAEKLTYDWSTHGSVKQSTISRLRDVASLEHIGCAGADLCIALLPGGRGTHVEIGMALAAGVPVMLFSTNENHFQAHAETCAFYHHPMVVLKTTDFNVLISKAKAYLAGE